MNLQTIHFNMLVLVAACILFGIPSAVTDSSVASTVSNSNPISAVAVSVATDLSNVSNTTTTPSGTTTTVGAGNTTVATLSTSTNMTSASSKMQCTVMPIAIVGSLLIPFLIEYT